MRKLTHDARDPIEIDGYKFDEVRPDLWTVCHQQSGQWCNIPLPTLRRFLAHLDGDKTAESVAGLVGAAYADKAEAKRAAELLAQSAAPFDEACTIIRRLAGMPTQQDAPARESVAAAIRRAADHLEGNYPSSMTLTKLGKDLRAALAELEGGGR